MDRIVELGGNCLMTFASSPRSLKHKEIDPTLIKKYLEKKAKNSIGPHFFHGTYLVNLGTPGKNYLKASMDSLIFYQQIAAKIDAVGTIFHLGSYPTGLDRVRTLNQVVASINFVLDSSPKGTKLILENAAGQGTAVGENLEDLARIIDRVGDKAKIGVCLDTQHAWASGISLDSLLLKFDRAIGLKHLSVIHLNDSKTDFGSKVDRHANLGEGKIGLENLKEFVNSLAKSYKLTAIPLILEVPGDGAGPRKQDIKTLKSLLQ